MKKKIDNSNKPWVANYPPLDEWLKKHEARCNWQIPMGDADNPVAYLESYMINGHEAIVIVRANRLGWEIFTSGDSNRVDLTMADADARLGLAPAVESATSHQLTTISATLREQYAEHLGKLKKTPTNPCGLTPKRIDDLAAGHADGLRNMILALRAQSLLMVREDGK